MKSGKGGMGKSPKFKYNQKMLAEKQVKKKKPTTCVFKSVLELLKKKGVKQC